MRDDRGVTPYERLQPYLRPQEEVLWAGGPDATVLFSSADVFVVPFSLMWGAFVIFWEVAVVSSGGPAFFVAWGIPFVLIGLYMIFGRFIYKRRQRRRTLYAITDQRALALVGDRTLTDTPVKYQPVTIKRSRDGRHASVIIGNGIGPWRGAAMYANTGMDFFSRSAGAFSGFFDVADPDERLMAVEKART
jgi:hypothetical protein